jgi:predicted unusual protein kinase regulating ubiquinone biosynthesis (AarF/ABC1/UbiB family)
MNKRIGPEVATMIRENLLATVTRDPERYVKSLLDADMIDLRDADAVRELARLSFAPEYYNLTPKEMANLDFGEYFKRMRSHMKKVRTFRLPDGLVMWSRAITLLLGLSTELAPGIRPLEVVGPYMADLMAGPAVGAGARS